VGTALLGLGCGEREVQVVSRIGEKDQSVTKTDLNGLANGTFDPMSVVLLRVPDPSDDGPGLQWGLPESSFAHRNRMITKSTVRAAALGKLSLPPAGVVWDVGAGSGSVAIEIQVVEGTAPDVFEDLPDPDRIFIGGGGLGVLEAALDRLRPGGVIVATYAMLDRATSAWKLLGNMTQITVSNAVPIADGVRLAAENPVFLCWGPLQAAS
jgi:precorrin-6Y C5,15-methyltransferase (decarboxylating)